MTRKHKAAMPGAVHGSYTRTRLRHRLLNGWLNAASRYRSVVISPSRLIVRVP
jgi:hypothetical protein